MAIFGPEPERGRSTPEYDEESKSTKARILVVDDDPNTVALVTMVLERQGYEVFTADEGREALAIARELKPDLVILEITIPGLNGYEVCRRLQRHPATAHIPVLILTTEGRIEDDERPTSTLATRMRDRLLGFDSGAMDFMSKPVKAKELTQRVKTLLWAGGVPV